jgi:hypothetical protein
METVRYILLGIAGIIVLQAINITFGLVAFTVRRWIDKAKGR